MCQGRSHRNSISCILPPYILDAIARNAAPRERTYALQTSGTDTTFRIMRVNHDLLSAVGRRLPTAVPAGQPQRTIYDTHNTTRLPGDVVRAEGAVPTGDLAVDEAYGGLGDTYNLYWMVYQRNSIDDQGLPLDATVHFDQHYDNAFWNGERMVFGDGDGVYFNRFTIPVDVIGHELTHGVIGDEAKLIYLNQPGALNESIADVFGSLVKQFAAQQTAEQADWLIGVGLYTERVQGVALRSMKAPGTAYDDPVLGKDPQPGTMHDYVQTLADNGGVHINSGIPNHAFALAAIQIGGYAWERAGRIWYETLLDPHLRPTASFQAFAHLTVANADRLYGQSSPERLAVRDAWREVGVTIS
jgi:Zn-dependent metalloprotease